MGTTTSYVPHDYRRVCDLCGGLYNISKMFRKGPYTYCYEHRGERINEELDRGNAAQRPFRILPVPNAKPEDQVQPDVFEAEESRIFDLVAAGRAGGARYLQVVSGTEEAQAYAADVIPVNAWGAIHYYNLAVATYPRGHTDVWHAQALAGLQASANTLLALQTTSGTRATNAYYGGLLATGATFYYSEDAAVAGLAFIYAYRLLGDVRYLYAARSAASFLRNLQAIGSNGTAFTSTDSAGNARLYTGGITNFVNGVAFFADHRFYPSSLLALHLWNELRITDGDQTIGASAAIAGAFSTAPAKLMTAAMADLRAFWATGTYDVASQTVKTGLSATTPAECFNAYPATKPNSGTGSGTVLGRGAWVYEDGPETTGTTISALNFAKALYALYMVDGLTDQITAIDDWLQTFTSNSAFETGTVSTGTLAHAVTGTYDPKIAPAKYLLVRDSTQGYAATAKNGFGLYDWGAFGLLSPIWAARRGATFKSSRAAACTRRRRLSDGLPSDGFWDDRGYERGRQGLTNQTAFLEALDHGSGAQA